MEEINRANETKVLKGTETTVRGQWPMEHHIFIFGSVCSFICLQAVYQLSGPVCKSTWRSASFLHA